MDEWVTVSLFIQIILGTSHALLWGKDASIDETIRRRPGALQRDGLPRLSGWLQWSPLLASLCRFAEWQVQRMRSSCSRWENDEGRAWPERQFRWHSHESPLALSPWGRSGWRLVERRGQNAQLTHSFSWQWRGLGEGLHFLSCSYGLFTSYSRLAAENIMHNPRWHSRRDQDSLPAPRQSHSGQNGQGGG